jgi:undecaprenyl diphosphate synthase
MDGNGRWARAHGKERAYGHIQGVNSVREVVKAAVRSEVSYLTLYVFSKENLGRPREEVDALMELFCKSVINETPELVEQGVRVEVIGDRTVMSDIVREHVELIERRTAEGNALTLMLAFDYGSRAEITEAAKRIAASVARGETDPAEITEDTLSANLYTAGKPDPDLIIRTGGDRRISNFLLWQSAYSELYFTDEYWPDFGADSFAEALASYAKRERKYGLLNNTQP